MGFMVMDEPWDGWAQWTRNGKARYDYSYYFLDWWQRTCAISSAATATIRAS